MKKRVLLIDDDPIINMINTKIIGSMIDPTFIDVAINGEEGINLVKSSPDVHSLIFLDINMPVMNGWDFLDEYLKKCTSYHSEIHILSSSIHDEDHIRSSQCSLVESFILKPVSKDLIQPVITSFFGNDLSKYDGCLETA